MKKGLGHYSSTSAWDGNIGVCGHNRGSKYVIGSIKDLRQGDTITYTTKLGTRTYQVVTVERLMEESPFADLGQEDPLFATMRTLAESRAVVYSDNCLRLDKPMTWGELSMLLTPKEEALGRRWEKIRATGQRQHPYYGGMEFCKEHGYIPAEAVQSDPVKDLPQKFFSPAGGRTRREVYQAYQG